MNTTAMEQMTKYWAMLAARSSTTTSLSRPWSAVAVRGGGGGEPSWEEQAFARDAAGHLGGCVWPPRSYACSFCRREFRSAQALGGHMNVHRRDRARLRQCSSPDDDVQAPHDETQNQDSLLYRALLSNPKATTGDLPSKEVVTSPTTTPSYISTIIKESKKKIFVSAPRETIECDDDEEEEERSKRRRVDLSGAVAIPFFMRPLASCERGVDHDAKVQKISTSPSSGSLLVGQQEVDLELRLGTSPKVA